MQFGNFTLNRSESALDRRARLALDGLGETDQDLKDITIGDFQDGVNVAGKSNAQWADEAIARADSCSFGIARPEVLQTAKNMRLINHWLQTKSINASQYADFDAAVSELSAQGLLDMDAAELARDKKQYTGISRSFVRRSV